MKSRNTIYIIILICALYWVGSRYIFGVGKEHFKSSEIPLHIYQTWKTHDLPDNMQKCVDNLIEKNPEFTHHLYDDVDCYNFIKENFDPEVAEAYDTLIPGAFKADFWRCCILYKKGGIYLDIKYSNVGDFKLIELTDKEYFVRDIEKSGGGIYNAFMICKPGNKHLDKCIRQMVENVKNRFYGHSLFSPTGPLLMSSQFTEAELEDIKNNGLGICTDGCPTQTCICRNGIPILNIYKEYYEKEVTTDIPRYHQLWDERKIYKP